MKFLDYLFHGKELKAIGNYFKMLNGYSPTFTSFSGGVYEMDLTRTAINNFATHCSKLKPEIEGSALKSLEKTLQHKPNYFMDTTKFIKRLATYVAVEHTAFIIPIEDEYGRLCGWYPLRAERCEVVESEGQLYLRYLFANGSYGAIEFERVGIMTDFEYKDDLFGEDNSTLAPTMQLIHTQNEGIINAVKNSANIRFLAKVANILKPEDIKKERKRFTEDNLSADNDSGMIIYDNKFSELKQVESKPYTPNALQMQHIQENVCTHFGTNMDILQNKFDENTWNAYYEGKIEPFAIQLSLVMTNMSFTERERACGNAIFFSANRLQYASNATKLSVSTQLFDRALLNRNGVMDIWNMAHVEDGEKYYIRKEYTEVSELHKGSEQPVIIQQVPQQTEPAAGEEPQNGQEEKEGVNMPVKKEREYRTLVAPLAAQSSGEKRLQSECYVEGYATTFNAPYLLYEFEDGTKIYERIDAHALDSADMSDVIMQYDHEGRVFARQSNNTLILEPDVKGLFVAADLSRTDLARGLYQDISAGMITKMSWAFTVAEESYDRETHTRTILKIKKVYDVSAVSIPANNDTEISARAFASRSYERERQELLKRRAAILKIKASL